MDETAIERASALENHYKLGHFGDKPESNIIFHELKNLKLYQIAFWPNTQKDLEANLLRLTNIKSIPKPNRSIFYNNIALLRIEPLKVWLLGSEAPPLQPKEAVVLDLSHSRLHLQISGPQTTALLNSFLPIDLRKAAFPQGKSISTSFHHVGITLWRTKAEYNLFIPRGFALSLWELLLEGAAQFGYDVT